MSSMESARKIFSTLIVGLMSANAYWVLIHESHGNKVVLLGKIVGLSDSEFRDFLVIAKFGTCQKTKNGETSFYLHVNWMNDYLAQNTETSGKIKFSVFDIGKRSTRFIRIGKKFVGKAPTPEHQKRWKLPSRFNELRKRLHGCLTDLLKENKKSDANKVNTSSNC